MAKKNHFIATDVGVGLSGDFKTSKTHASNFFRITMHLLTSLKNLKQLSNVPGVLS